MTPNDGGPAFGGERTELKHIFQGQPPTPVPIVYSGLSIRDWFAGQALSGMHSRDTFDTGLSHPEQRAKLAYIDADALMAERAKETQ